MEIKYRTQFPELLAHYHLKGEAVELGVAEGRNAEVLIASPQVEKLYLIDNWSHLEQSGDGGHPQSWHENNFKEAQERVEPFKRKAHFLKGLSSEMIQQIPDESLIFAYIDCDHSYEGFRSDLNAIYKKVKPSGIIAGHDVLNPAYGVGTALKNWVDRNGYSRFDVRFTEEDGDNSMVSFWFVKK